jgi:hypothetical protein
MPVLFAHGFSPSSAFSLASGRSQLGQNLIAPLPPHVVGLQKVFHVLGSVKQSRRLELVAEVEEALCRAFLKWLCLMRFRRIELPVKKYLNRFDTKRLFNVHRSSPVPGGSGRGLV